MALRKTKDTVVRANSKIEYGVEVYTLRLQIGVGINIANT